MNTSGTALQKISEIKLREMSISPFFRVPREIRDRIYHFAFFNQRAAFQVANLKLYVHYLEDLNHTESYENDNLRWLMTSIQVLVEGLEQFYVHAKLRNYCIWGWEAEHDLTLDGHKSIFDLTRVKNVELYLKLGKSYLSTDDKFYETIIPRGKERWDGNDEDFSELGKAIRNLDRACAFEDLKLTVSLFRTENMTKNYEDTGNRFIVNLGGADTEDRAEGDVEIQSEHTGPDSDMDEDDYSYSSSSDSYNENYWNAYGTNLSHPSEVDDYLIDFSFLQNLTTQWKHIEIEYIPTFMQRYFGDEDPLDANVFAVPIIQKKLAEAAKTMVRGKCGNIQDRLEEQEGQASWWVLDVWHGETEGDAEMRHMGLKSYLAECENCGCRSEKFVLQPDGKDGTVSFESEQCGTVISIDTPVLGYDNDT